MKKGRIIVLFLIVAFGCRKKQDVVSTTVLSSEDILNKCISFHDPSHIWPSLSSENTLTSNSIYTNGLDEKVIFGSNNETSEFYYKNPERHVSLYYGPESCKSLDSAGSCNSYEWASRFYPFIWGLPMKLNDKEVNLEKKVGDTLILNRPSYVLYNSYETENWQFYIDKQTFSLNGFKFIIKSDPTKGELVLHAGISNMNGIKTPLKRSWFDLKENQIGTDYFVQSDTFNTSPYAE